MLSPVVSHVPCDLDQQRRIQDARRANLARRIAQGSGRGRWPFSRRRGRPGENGTRPADPLPAEHLRPVGEDVWHSLRF
jgi:hypothetical protein